MFCFGTCPRGSGANIVLFGNEVGGTWWCLSQTFRLRTFAYSRNLTTLLRRVVFVCKAALRLCLDLQRIGLRAIRCGDQFIMGDRSGSLRWFGGYGSLERAEPNRTPNPRISNPNRTRTEPRNQGGELGSGAGKSLLKSPPRLRVAQRNPALVALSRGVADRHPMSAFDM
jgi:hypothetical protein